MPVESTLRPVAGQPGTFPRLVGPAASGPAASGLPVAASGGTSVGSGSAGSGSVAGTELAYTGRAIVPTLLVGLLALLLGLGLTVLSRRRVSLLA
jgi:hypothetical protein